MDWVPLVLTSAVPMVLVGGLLQRVFYRRAGDGVSKTSLGNGWQFIRFTVLATGLPLVGLLAVKGQLTGEVIAIYSAALGFAFGNSGKDD